MREEIVLQTIIDGAPYTLCGDISDERLQQIATLVADKIAHIRSEAPHYSPQRAAVLAALQLAEELLSIQDEYLELLSEADIGGEIK